VAAVVLGGVVLGGGIGGILGPIIAVFILRIIRTILTLAAVDPNVTTIVEGTIMVAVVMFGAFLVMRRGARRERSCIPQAKRTMSPPRAHRAVPQGQSGHPADRAPFAGSLIGVLEVMRPGIISPFWAGNTIKFAIPLAMLAACQVLTMLTAGIDLSAGIVATVSAFVVASITPLYGPFAGVLVALGAAVLVGLVNGFGVGVARVHPLIMTLGTGLIATGCLQVYQRFVINTGIRHPGLSGMARHGTHRRTSQWAVPIRPFATIILSADALHRVRAPAFALGSNEKATKLSGVRSWQVFMALYALSA
jgi:ribose/xylose/arabinose/galactoside ABC-type transport system permease subunit